MSTQISLIIFGNGFIDIVEGWISDEDLYQEYELISK